MYSPASRQPGDYSKDDAADRDARAYQQALDQLQGEFVDALLTNPQQLLGTPGWGSRQKMSAIDVLFEVLDCKPELRNSVVALLAECQRHADPLIRIQAQAIFAKAGEVHAKWHA